MEVTFKLDPDDLWQFNLYVIKRVPSFVMIFVTRILLMPLVIATAYVTLFKSWPLGLLIFVCLEVIWTPFVLWSARHYNLKVINGRPGVLNQQTVSIASEGVRQKTSNSDSLMSWQSFVEIAENPRIIVFFMDKRHGIIIPKTAFNGAEEASNFYAPALALWMGKPAPALPQTPGVWPPPPRRS